MIKYLAKFVQKSEYADSLLSGKLFMRPALYYHSLELGQGDIREAAIFDNICIYKHSSLPIFCMYSISNSDIKNGHIVFSERCIRDFGCENGYVVIFNYSLFEPLLSTVQTNGYELYAGKVNYHKLDISESAQLLCDDSPRNLFIKHPFFAYQKEYRIVVSKQVYQPSELFVDHIEYSFPSTLNNTASIIPITELYRQNGDYILSML